VSESTAVASAPANEITGEFGDLPTCLRSVPLDGGKLKTLIRKLAEVMGEIERVPKRGRNAFYGYDYATEADILAAMRGELAQRGVMLLSRLVGYRREQTKTRKGETTYLWFVDVEFTFVDSESGETLVTPWTGMGEDPGDKGLYKGLTGATKYFVLKTFLISTGDDPEDDGQRANGGRTSEQRDQDRRDNRENTTRTADRLREAQQAQRAEAKAANGTPTPTPQAASKPAPAQEPLEPGATADEEPQTAPPNDIYHVTRVGQDREQAGDGPRRYYISTRELTHNLETTNEDVARACLTSKKNTAPIVIRWATESGRHVIMEVGAVAA
jgi:hypothetical protein